MKKERRKSHLEFWIFFAVFSVLYLALLELNKNPVFTWILAVAILVAYTVVRMRIISEKKLSFRILSFLFLCTALVALLLFAVGPVRLHPALEGKSGGPTDIITVTGGQLTGVYTSDRAVEVYAGIPYAAPPVGNLRWKEPQDPMPWDGVFTADSFSPMSMQPQNSVIYNSLAQIIGYHDYHVSFADNFRDANSEDALYLNIWKPAGKQENLPVLVYIHGGSLQTGQPWYADYSGEGLARKGVLVVNMGYRLGVFGFLATEEAMMESPNGTTGNYGLLDQIKALQWVQDNISSFGGDPGNVTLAGESAGSACVSALCTSPLASGLFRRVIGESSTVSSPMPAHSFRLLDDALETGKETLSRFGASNLNELRQMDAKILVSAADINHHMTIDGYVLNELPYDSYRKGIHNEEACLHGYNAKESAPFILFSQANLKNYEEKIRSSFGPYADQVLKAYPATSNEEAKKQWADIYSVYFFNYGHFCWSRQAIKNGFPAYEYYFTKENGRLGSWHSGEEIYCYNNIPADSRLYNTDDRTLAELFSDYVVSFIRTGNPNTEGLPYWQESKSAAELMEFGVNSGMIQDSHLPLYAILDNMYGWE